MVMVKYEFDFNWLIFLWQNSKSYKWKIISRIFLKIIVNFNNSEMNYENIQ